MALLARRFGEPERVSGAGIKVVGGLSSTPPRRLVDIRFL